MVLVEREDQLAVFTEALHRCRDGAGSLLTVTGTFASGKTALLRAFADRGAEAGFVVLTGTGARTERGLPLSLVTQFCPDLVALTGERIDTTGLDREIHATALRHSRGSLVPGPRLGALLNAATVALLRTGHRTPVLLLVDDLHHVDPLSLHCLLYLVRRIPRTRVLVVVAGGELVEPTDQQPYAELMELAGEQLALPPLTADGVGDLLTAALGTRPDTGLVDACARASGGNPLLTRTLADDLRENALDHRGQLTPGRAYSRAVRRYVERCDPVIRRVLAATAVFDGDPAADALTVARLADVGAAAAVRTLSALETSGLVSGGRLPHPTARQAVLDQLLPGDLTQQHLHAARLLHEGGSTPLPIARHLLAAGQAPRWSRPVLRVAVEGLLATGDSATAIDLLRLAHDGTADEREQAELKFELLRAEWRTDPATAGHRLPQLVDAATTGLLSDDACISLTHSLLWLGRTADAAVVLDRLHAGDAPVSGLRLLTAWTRFTHPDLVPDDATEPRDNRAPGEQRPGTREALAQALETTLAKGPTSAAVVAAEQALQRSTLSGRTLPQLIAALTVLVHADHLETAALWTERLVAKAAQHGASSWRAMLLAIRGDIALRSGRLAEAQTYAEIALVCMSAASWGPGIGLPLSTLLAVHVERGRFDDARRQLEVPVPDDLFDSVWGLGYLRARGAYYLATGRPEAALEDFLTCWDHMARWNLDLPAIVGWRVLAAHAHLALGRPDQARALAEGQLTLLGPEPGRVKAATLRVLAAAVPLAQRPTMLREAAAMLRASGDRLELAHTLADLSEAQRGLGDFHRARMTVRRACDLASDCQADALRARLLPDVDDTGTEPGDDADAEAFNSLSDAERRVATLAAQGSTNRQIASKLFVTVSTVEQHLTKIYRKLNVARRADLLVKLGPRVSNVA